MDRRKKEGEIRRGEKGGREGEKGDEARLRRL